MPRLFIALDIPAEVKDQLVAFKTDLQGARWSKPAQYHLTLRFLGDTNQAEVPELEAAQGNIKAPILDLVFDGLGTFSHRKKPRVLFASLTPEPALIALQAHIESLTQELGFEVEPKPFRQHITLARFKYADADEVKQYVDEQKLEGKFQSRSFSLYESRLTSAGARYSVLRTFALG